MIEYKNGQFYFDYSDEAENGKQDTYALAYLKDLLERSRKEEAQKRKREESLKNLENKINESKSRPDDIFEEHPFLREIQNTKCENDYKEHDDKNNKETITNKYDEIKEYDNCFKAKHNNLYDIFNAKGELVLHDIKDIKSYKKHQNFYRVNYNEHVYGSYNEHVYVVQNKENKWGMYNSKFKEIIPCKYKSISNITQIQEVKADHFSLGYFRAVDENNKISLYSILLDKAIKNEHELVSNIFRRRSLVLTGWVIRNQDYKYGYADRYFRVVIPCQYKELRLISSSGIVAQDEKGYYSLWDKRTGKKIFDNITAYTKQDCHFNEIYVKNINEIWFKVDLSNRRYTKCGFNRTNQNIQSKAKKKTKNK